ncbi:hypothetical protein SEVIR_5G207500v4 [Setaria viridis]|uniref:Uncharacterized protein n=1 Tax=Setaria viridis TaxID=4556 RepID=A0A4U6ULC1_SETVI|nr:hypothetical protein SEVIR_5G207500v2 [Setaria viridis]
MARAYPTTSASSKQITAATSSSPALLHAAWVAAAVAVCVALCTIHARKPSSSSSRRRGSRSASNRCGSRESGGGGGGGGAASGATPAAKVSPTPSDTAKASGAAVETDGGGGPVTVIDVGTHGPIAPAFLPPPAEPLPPRRSLSSKHIRFTERLGRIRSMRRAVSSGEAAATAAAEDDVFVGCRRGGGGEVGEEGTLWTKTIILGERCRVPSAGDEGDVDGGGGDGTVPWRSYRPRQPRSVPVTRSNSFAGVGSAGACRLADPRF